MVGDGQELATPTPPLCVGSGSFVKSSARARPGEKAGGGGKEMAAVARGVPTTECSVPRRESVIAPDSNAAAWIVKGLTLLLLVALAFSTADKVHTHIISHAARNLRYKERRTNEWPLRPCLVYTEI